MKVGKCGSVWKCESVKVLLDSRTFVEIRALSRFVAIRASFGRLLAKKRWEGAQKHFKGPGLVVWKYESIKVWKGGMGSMKVAKYERMKVLKYERVEVCESVKVWMCESVKVWKC